MRRSAALAPLLSALVAVLAVPPAVAEVGPHPALAEAKITERPGNEVPLDARLVDHTGRAVRLGHYFDGRDPVILVLAYARCPMLCPLVLRSTATALSVAGRRPGDGFRVVTVSFDPRDTPADAARARRATVGSTWPGLAADDWAFLVGGADEVRRVARAVGFGYRFDPASGQYAHAAGVFVLAPDGRVSRTLYGVSFPPDEMAAALDAAAAGEAGRSLQQVLIQCFCYTPALRRWSGALALLLRGSALAILVGLGTVFWFARRRGARRRAGEGTR